MRAIVWTPELLARVRKCPPATEAHMVAAGNASCEARMATARERKRGARFDGSDEGEGAR